MKIRDFFCALLLSSAVFPVFRIAALPRINSSFASASFATLKPNENTRTANEQKSLVSSVSSVNKSSDDLERFKKSLKTYVGVYPCREGRYGERELTECVDALRLELKADGSYLLTFSREKGKSVSCSGKYSVEGETLVFSAPRGDGLPLIDGVHRAYARKKGEIVLATNIGGKLLYLRFARTVLKKKRLAFALALPHRRFLSHTQRSTVWRFYVKKVFPNRSVREYACIDKNR